MSVFLPRKRSSSWPLPRLRRIGELHALSYRVSHTRDWGEISFAFVTSFVAKTQDPSSLAPRFEGFTVPAYQTRERIAMGDYCVLCGQSRFTSTALLHIVHDVSGCLSPQGVARRRFRRPRSPSGSGRRYHALTSSLGLHCLCLPPSSRDAWYRSVNSFSKEFCCRPGVEGGYVAQAYHLYASLLEGHSS